jgi:hypothetical protein
MTIKGHLNRLLLRILYYNFPNSTFFVIEQERLVFLFEQAFARNSFNEAIKEFKLSQLYTVFKLDTKPQIFASILTKIYNYEIIREILYLASEIKFSKLEKKMLDVRFKALLLASLEIDLKKTAPLAEQADYNPKNGVNRFQEFERLNAIFSANAVSLSDIDWFFNSSIFNFITNKSESVRPKLNALYQILIQNAKLDTITEFNNHCRILLAKKTNAGMFFDYNGFYTILKQRSTHLFEDGKRTLEIHTQDALFYKKPKCSESSLHKVILKRNFAKACQCAM